MIKGFLHSLAAHPIIYNLIQKFAGADRVYERINAQMPPVHPTTILLDVGGGTGLSYQLLKLASAKYICLDVDPVKIVGFHQNFPAGWGVQGDAMQLPIPTGSVDVVIMAAVSHHLPEAVFEEAIQEMIRVLKPSGKLIFLDAIWAPANLPGRLIWSLDRGSYPRTAEQLQGMLGLYGHHLYNESFKILHRYVLCVVTPPPPSINVLIATTSEVGL